MKSEYELAMDSLLLLSSGLAREEKVRPAIFAAITARRFARSHAEHDDAHLALLIAAKHALHGGDHRLAERLLRKACRERRTIRVVKALANVAWEAALAIERGGDHGALVIAFTRAAERYEELAVLARSEQDADAERAAIQFATKARAKTLQVDVPASAKRE